MRTEDGCLNCRYRLKLKKYDYRKHGCKHTDMDGFICLAFAYQGVANWMVGLDNDNSRCEAWFSKDEQIPLRCAKCSFYVSPQTTGAAGMCSLLNINVCDDDYCSGGAWTAG